MDLATGDAPRSFSDRVLRLLERVEHRVATDPADRKAAFRLRCEAYQKAGFMKGAIGEIYDPLYDDDPNGWTTMTFVDGELAGTVRINVGFNEHAVLSALETFHDVLLPKLHARRVIIEFTRLAAKLSLSSLYPELAYVIMRPGSMAAAHFDVDFAVAAGPEHVAFYRRTFGAEMWCAPRDYPGTTTKLPCMGADYRFRRTMIEARYPFYKSEPLEREALFGPCRGPSSGSAARSRAEDLSTEPTSAVV